MRQTEHVQEVSQRPRPGEPQGFVLVRLTGWKVSKTVVCPRAHWQSYQVFSQFLFSHGFSIKYIPYEFSCGDDMLCVCVTAARSCLSLSASILVGSGWCKMFSWPMCSRGHCFYSQGSPLWLTCVSWTLLVRGLWWNLHICLSLIAARWTDSTELTIDALIQILTTDVFTVYCRDAHWVLHLFQPNGECHLSLFCLWHHLHYIILLLTFLNGFYFLRDEFETFIDVFSLLSISVRLYTFWQYSHMQGRTLGFSDPFLHVPVPEPSLMTFFPSGNSSWSPKT